MILSFGSVVIGILAFVFALALIILIHEGGHFFFARRANILCREYAFGMGPQLVKYKKGETTYAINLLPIGGYCAIAGEEVEDDPLKELKQVRLVIENGVIKKFIVDDKNHLFDDYPLYEIVSYDIFDEQDTGKLYMVIKENDEEIEYPVDPQAMYVFTKPYSGDKTDIEKKRNKYASEIQIAPHNRTLNAKSKTQRALVMFGGPLMNFVLAIIVFFFAGLMMGFSDTSSTELANISEGTSSYIAGLRDGDVITALETSTITKQETNKWDDISSFMTKYKEDTSSYEEIKVYYTSNGENKTTMIYPQTVIYSISILQDLTDRTNVKVGEVSEAAPAYKGGMRTGDIIQKISYKDGDSYDVHNWKDVYNIFLNNEEGEEMNITVLRDGEVVKCTVDPYSRDLFKRTQSVDTAVVLLGVSPSTKHSFWKSIAYSFTELVASVKKMFFTLGYLFFSKEVGINDLSGPVGIYSLTSQAAQGGFANLLYWIGFLSVNVGFLNLLPIPALDGGRLLFVGIEAVTKKKVSAKVETILINITMLLLFALIIFVSFNDVLRLIGVK